MWVYYPIIRRAIEFTLVVLLLPFAFLVGLLTALAVALDSRGGVFFIQTRPGKNGVPFRMLKFRTMKVAPQVPFRLTDAHDARLTRTGRWMRALHLDEIPQLWHVLVGEMSLIGPRPVPMELYAEFLEIIPDYDTRHTIAPGVTGLAQICLGYVNTLEGEREKYLYDRFYISYQGPKLDAWVLWATFVKMLGIRVDHTWVEAQVLAENAKKSAP